MAVKKKFPYRAAVVACKGGCQDKGGGACAYGCTGCGKCVEVCRFGAVSINEAGVSKVDEKKCIACGMCVKSCPRKVIHLHECANSIVVKCSNQDEAKQARDICKNSCIGCGACEKACTAGAVRVAGHCAVIEEEVCLSCGMCVVKCPRGAIVDLRGVLNK